MNIPLLLIAFVAGFLASWCLWSLFVVVPRDIRYQAKLELEHVQDDLRDYAETHREDESIESLRREAGFAVEQWDELRLPLVASVLFNVPGAVPKPVLTPMKPDALTSIKHRYAWALLKGLMLYSPVTWLLSPFLVVALAIAIRRRGLSSLEAIGRSIVSATMIRPNPLPVT